MDILYEMLPDDLKPLLDRMAHEKAVAFAVRAHMMSEAICQDDEVPEWASSLPGGVEGFKATAEHTKNTPDTVLGNAYMNGFIDGFCFMAVMRQVMEFMDTEVGKASTQLFGNILSDLSDVVKDTHLAKKMQGDSSHHKPMGIQDMSDEDFLRMFTTLK